VRIMDRDVFLDSLVGVASTHAHEVGTAWLPLVSHGTGTGAVKVEVRFVPSDGDTVRLSELRVFAGGAPPSATPGGELAAATPTARVALPAESVELELKPPFKEYITEYSLFVDAHVSQISLRAVPATHCFNDRRAGERVCGLPSVTLEALGVPAQVSR
jgi:hypothetical protein